MRPLSLPGRILVTGANGFMGKNAVELLGPNAIALPRTSLDITIPAEVERCLDETRPWAVLNAAALADVERAEADPELAWRINATAPGQLARACAARGIHLCHLSTDYVFGGRPDRRYEVNDPTSPVNHYGASKVEGERLVLLHHPQALVARTAWVFGRHSWGSAARALERLLQNKPTEAILDRFGHPSYVVDVIERCLELLVLGVPGIYHVVNQGPTSWYAFILRLAERLALPTELVRGVSHLELPPRAPRPVEVALQESPQRPGVDLPPLRAWQEAQDAWLRELVTIGMGQHR